MRLGAVKLSKSHQLAVAFQARAAKNECCQPHSVEMLPGHDRSYSQNLPQ